MSLLIIFKNFICLVSSIKHRYGIVHYETPIFISETWFNGFETTDKYVGGALGFQPNKKMSGPYSSNTTDIRFGGVDKVCIQEDPIKCVLMVFVDNKEIISFRNKHGH